MKKILALALAMIMTLGLASVAFAADTTPEVWIENDAPIYDEDGDRVKLPNENLATVDTLADANPDTEYYVPLSMEGYVNEVTDKDALKGYKVFFESKVGKLAADPEIVFKKLAGEYVYAVKLSISDVTTKAYDVAGDLKVAKTASAAKNVPEGYYCQINLEVAYGKADAADGIVDNDKPVLEFDNVDDIIDLEDEEQDLFLFSVNGNGQSDLNMKYSTKFDSSFAAKYDYANIDFLKFSKEPVFNRTGDLYIYADEDSYIYEVTANGAKEIANAEYDEDYGAWHIRTRSLKAYAISDSELKATESASSTPAESTGSSTDSTGKPNPSTGR